ncbi:MAG: hypothetical protein K5930_05760 [Treponemataceae bacterium]|nr:hypothetical protein [Treponemataceae bacterium]
MEELRSTEILDREIQEDARKKADRMVSDAEKEAGNIREAVKERIRIAQEERKSVYAAKEAAFKADAEAALPLKKERFLAAYENDAVINAIDDYIAALDPAKKLDLIKQLLSKYAPAFENKKINAVVCGFNINTMKKALEEVAGKDKVLSCEEAPKGQDFEGCIIETDDRSVKCRATISELVSRIVDADRYELASALFGGRLPE